MASRTSTKTASPKTSKTVGFTPITEKPQAANVEDERSLFERARIAVDAWLQSTSRPHWMRVIVSSLLGLIAAGSTYYFSAQWLTALVLWTATLTGSAFITFLVAFVGSVLAVMSAYTAGMWVYEKSRALDLRRIGSFFSLKGATQ